MTPLEIGLATALVALFVAFAFILIGRGPRRTATYITIDEYGLPNEHTGPNAWNEARAASREHDLEVDQIKESAEAKARALRRTLVQLALSVGDVALDLDESLTPEALDTWRVQRVVHDGQVTLKLLHKNVPEDSSEFL